LPKRLLPVIPADLVVDHILSNAKQLTILTRPHQQSAACPSCAEVSARVHSFRQRTLRDLPCQGRPVVLRVHLRRFRCLNPACPRQTFVEPLTDAARASARRTKRLAAVQHHLGLALGGEAGARLAETLAMPISPDTLLRLTGRTDGLVAPCSTPRVLAVDDWSWRRGRRYGTILVDLERNTVVDLLPDRQANSLANWLRQHPGVEIVARDRAGAYADGIRQGAPKAVQVTDRWHLLRNLSEAVQAVVARQYAAIRRVTRQMAEEAMRLTASIAEPAPTAPIKTTAAERRRQASFAQRQARYEEIVRLKAAGMPLTRVAALIGADRKTVRRWLRAGGVPLWRHPQRGGLLGPYRAYLDRRWQEGCHNAAQLWRELIKLGFAGRPATVRHWAGQRRNTEPRAPSRSRAHADVNQAPSARRLTRLLMSNDVQPAAEQSLVSRVLKELPGLADCVAAAKRLNEVLQRNSPENLEQVLKVAAGTALKDFVASLRRDLKAVQAALELPWTTSPAEGQINRLKLLKRSMYGRAGFKLLRARVLQAA
jgi:transposase